MKKKILIPILSVVALGAIIALATSGVFETNWDAEGNCWSAGDKFTDSGESDNEEANDDELELEE